MARVTERRLWVKLTSKDALRRYMKFHDMTITDLARRADVPRATVGFLCSEGKSSRMTCSPDNAAKIEKTLGVPHGLLFEPRLSTVVRDIRQDAA